MGVNFHCLELLLKARAEKILEINKRVKELSIKFSSFAGFYVQNGEKFGITFQKASIDKNGVIKGKGADEIGNYEVNGKIEGENFEMKQKYLEGSKEVDYKGKIERGDQIKGEWVSNGERDQFELFRLYVIIKWEGYF